MGFHKRYIDDTRIREIYKSSGAQGVINLYTKGVDAVITSGDIADTITTVLHGTRNTQQKIKKISELIDAERHQKDLTI